ncbi:MAG TPA: MFS transporter, partial [Spirochaetia bacterium]
LGIIVAMIVTPLLVVSSPDSPRYGQGIDTMLMIYGVATFVLCVVSIAALRERPAGTVVGAETQPARFTAGLRQIFRQRDMVITIVLFFIGLGIFNAVSSMTDAISASIGVRDSNGLIGGLMLVGGVVGAVVLPGLSDHFRKRRLFLVICMAGMVPGVAGLAFAGRIAADPSAAYGIALAASFVLGFFVMSAGPIGFQYAAEVSAPAPESTSQGILLLSGQITGLVFVAGMTVRSNRYLPGFMTAFALLSVLSLVGVLFLRESPMIVTDADRVKAGEKR